MKQVYLFCVLVFIGLTGKAQQNYFIVTGTVYNGTTLQPMQGASVFAQNTTLGTATDVQGNFKLYLPPGGYDVAVTFTGFATEIRRVSSSEKSNVVEIYLKPQENELTEVSLVATGEVKDGWQKYGDFFLENFIGKTVNSKQCIITNPEVLKFYFSKRKNRLKVLAAEPLLIENSALGYNITYALDSFTYQYETEISFYTGYPLFEKMQSDDDAQLKAWDRAREIAYHGSLLHFMRSLYDQSLDEDGFEIQFIVSEKGKDKALKVKDYYESLRYTKDDSTGTVEIKPRQTNVGVIYKLELPAAGFMLSHPKEPANFQFSVLNFLPGESLIIEQNGYYFDQTDIAISAYWTWQKVADLLPYDYEFADGPVMLKEDISLQ